MSAHRVRLTVDSTVLSVKHRATMRAHGAERLAEAAATVRARPGRVQIVGYTDDLGSAAHGLMLSRQRAVAAAVVRRRELAGANYSLVVVGRGEADPAVPNTFKANRRLNRRVVITYEPG